MRAATTFLAIAVSFSATLLATAARAQDAAAEATTPGEQEALELYTNGMAISARTRAEAVLRDQPSSVIGHYVLGRVLFEAEGSLARAMFHLGRAREIYETTRMRVGLGTPFHQELLYTLARLAGQMELYEYELELLGYFDHLYDPDLIAERCWPLIKLGRVEEARELAQLAVSSPDPWQRSAGYNAACALEGEARTREPYHAACLAALEDARREAARAHDENEEQAGIAVDAYNAALAATTALRFSDAESYALEGVRRFEPTGANPHQLLVELYLSMGRTSDSLDSLLSMISWNDRQPAAMRGQGGAETEAVVALMMMIAGETERARERIDRALSRPDRRGTTTEGAEQARGRHALIRAMITRVREEELAEEASWTGLGAQVWNFMASFPRTLDRWPDDERVSGALSDSDRLVSTLRPYMTGGIAGASPWLVPELIDVLGPAVVAVALERARAEDHGIEAAEPFYRAMELELAAARGESTEVLTSVDETLRLLEAPGFGLMRARVAALGARAADDRGERDRARELYAEALQIDPGVMRRLGIALPVELEFTGGEAAEAADLLSRSPRFTERSGLFQIAIEPTDNGLRACLRTSTGNEIRCATALRPSPEQRAGQASSSQEAASEDDDDEEAEDEELTLPQLLAREVHRQLFSVSLALSSVDLSSLDGRTIGGSRMARERLRELVQD